MSHIVYQHVVTLMGDEADNALGVHASNIDKYTLRERMQEYDHGEPIPSDKHYDELPLCPGERAVYDRGAYAIVVHFGYPTVALYRRVIDD